MSESTDQHDLARSLDGDGHAYARLIARYQVQVARRMRKFTREPAVVQELVQDVFVESYYSLAKYRADGPFEAWLDRIAVRVGYRHWRQRDRERTTRLEPIDLSEIAQCQHNSLDASRAAVIIHSLLDQLPPRDRLVLLLLYVEGRSTAEAAKLVGWSKTMVHVQVFRAKKKLRNLLSQLGIETLDDAIELSDTLSSPENANSKPATRT